jgi:AmmeMemoRadiSam system protein A/AmmeMemoRadiSam system protein B
MMKCSPLVFVGIAPHPPIMVPEVGGARVAEVRASVDAMRELTERIKACGAETVVLVSPHAPLERSSFVAYGGSRLRGDFANFDAPQAIAEAPADEELLSAIQQAAAEEGFRVVTLEPQELDHGTAVPLYFLLSNGWAGRVVALGYSFLSDEEHVLFGECVRRAVDVTGRPAAFIASGDLSHRLKPGAPAGFDPEARRFDEQVVAAIRANEPGQVPRIDQGLRRRAGECGYRSVLVALGAAAAFEPECEVISYEAPFGVGYLVAQLSSPNESRITELARSAVEAYVLSGHVIEPPKFPETSQLARPSACFVCIKTLGRELRGCIGTVEPEHDTLAEEVISNAVKAATRDPRFRPVSGEELPSLRYSVDVLGNLEPARFEDLNPAAFGVVVTDQSGSRRGLLLPDIESIQTADQQVGVAARKAGINPGERLTLYRFRTRRFSEAART